MSTVRGRGISPRGRGCGDTVQPLRRPGEVNNLIQSEKSVTNTKDGLVDLTEKLHLLEISGGGEKDMSIIISTAKSISSSAEELNNAVDKIHHFSLKNKLNAHFGALLCQQLGDFEVEGTKFKIAIMRKVQGDYQDRKLKYAQIDKFLMNVVFLCELCHHMRLPDGKCISVLVSAIIDYFGMLVDGGSEKEIEVFVEQIHKIYKDLKTQNPEGLENVVSKIRKKIVAENVTITVRCLLLEIFEKVLLNWEPLGEKACSFYELLNKPINNICE